MTTDNKPPGTVPIGGRNVSLLVAALIAQEAYRLGIRPGEVGDVVIPDPPPTSVEIATCDIPIPIAAAFAAEADSRGMNLETLLLHILEGRAIELRRAARAKEAEHNPERAWQFSWGKGSSGGGSDGEA